MMVEGASAPFGFWDPAGLSKLGTPATQAWFKAAELKHSRVAMAATVGWIVNEAGIVFDGNIATGVPFVVGQGRQRVGERARRGQAPDHLGGGRY